MIAVDSGLPGPCVAVTANLHGDECTGVPAAHAIAARLSEALERGRVWLYPTLNPTGLMQATRGIPGEDLDPNRCFPGSSSGGAVSRHAAAIWDDVLARRPELVIDLHTDAGGAVPYALVDRVVRGPPALAERCLRLARASGLLVLREFPAEQYLKLNLDRSLPGALVNGPGIAAVTLEVGPRRAICPDAVELAVRASLGVLGALGLVRGAELPPFARSGIWRRDSGPKVTRAGLLVPLVRPGQDYARGEVLAELRGLAGDLMERLVAPTAGFVVALPDRAWVTPGMVVATVAVADE